MQTQCALYTKVFVNKKTATIRVLATFDTSRRDSTGKVVVTVQNAAFKSGDIANVGESEAVCKRAVERTLAQARAQCGTDNIVLL